MNQARKRKKRRYTMNLLALRLDNSVPLSLYTAVCFPERVPHREELPVAHTGASSKHPFPSQNTVGEFQILEMSLLYPVQFFVMVNVR